MASNNDYNNNECDYLYFAILQNELIRGNVYQTQDWQQLLFLSNMHDKRDFRACRAGVKFDIKSVTIIGHVRDFQFFFFNSIRITERRERSCHVRGTKQSCDLTKMFDWTQLSFVLA